MGGKQKRAAKLKRWKESQTITQAQLQGELTGEQSDESGKFSHPGSGSGSGSGEHDQLTENDHYKIRMEILRQRQKRGRKHNASFKWLTSRFNRLSKVFDHWPKWPFVLLVTLMSTVGLFFMIRSLIQILLPSNAVGIDRTPAYASVKHLFPGPIYKAIVLIDYMLTSSTLSWEVMTHIVFPPEREYEAAASRVRQF